jgi:hypothetical protein
MNFNKQMKDEKQYQWIRTHMFNLSTSDIDNETTKSIDKIIRDTISRGIFQTNKPKQVNNDVI